MVKKNDFIEIDFTGKIVGTDEIFDTTLKEEAKKANLDLKNLKPFVLSVGSKMLPVGFDEDLEGKESGKSYVVHVKADKAFGKRNPQMVKMIPTKMFHEQKIEPQRGMQLALDGQLVRILSSSGGRTLVDFNNPLAGKDITYNYTINKVVEDIKEKIDALQSFLFGRKFEFNINDKLVIFNVEKGFEPFIKMFAQKFEEILGMKVETKVVEKHHPVDPKVSGAKKEEKKAEKGEDGAKKD
ncbi:MAG: FKBP-type peptidyl-prolyl cis-trans isomerase [archaeon]|nr:FKBP-type peptidyl-prolyl cis-trans isomerase [archaeon]MCR4324013.1 FKBP-type peptidyl-prolyl cis-trans isomerase [Nanoarchaeota archaeon]